MSKVYKVQDDKVFRGQDVIATIEGDKLDFLEGMAKYRIHAVKAFKAYLADLVERVESPEAKESNTEKPKAPVIAKKSKKAVEGTWLERLSEIVGVKLPRPQGGYKRTIYRDLLMKNYMKIKDSNKLTLEEKKAIFKLFI